MISFPRPRTSGQTGKPRSSRVPTAFSPRVAAPGHERPAVGLAGEPTAQLQARDMTTHGWSVGSVAVAAVTVWEIAILAARNRLVLGCDPARWRSDRIADWATGVCCCMALRRYALPLRNARISGSRLGNPDSRLCGRCGHLGVPFETTDDDRTILRRVCAHPIALGID